jgi:hypothetical protein
MDNLPIVGALVGGAAVAVWYVSTSRAAPDESPACAIVKSAWESVSKTPGGRVDRASFKAQMMATHASKLTSVSRPHFDKFLDRCFAAGTGLMLAPGPEKTDLGKHCFGYCVLLAGEFYFSAASMDAASGTCGCDAPVADVLGLKKA